MKKLVIITIFVSVFSFVSNSETVITNRVYSMPQEASRGLNFDGLGWQMQKVANYGPTYDRRPLTKKEKGEVSGVGSLVRSVPEGEEYTSATIITPPDAPANRDFDILIATAHLFYNDDCSLKKGAFEFRPMNKKKYAVKINPALVKLEYKCGNYLDFKNDRVAIKIPRIKVNGIHPSTLGFGSIDNRTAYRMQQSGEAKFYLIAYSEDSDRMEISDNCKIFPSKVRSLRGAGINTDCDCGPGCSGAALVMSYTGTEYTVGTYLGNKSERMVSTGTDKHGRKLYQYNNENNFNLTVEVTEGFVDLIRSLSHNFKRNNGI